MRLFECDDPGNVLLLMISDTRCEGHNFVMTVEIRLLVSMMGLAR